jgi:hypothetical protein
MTPRLRARQSRSRRQTGHESKEVHVDEDISATLRKLISQEHALRKREAQSHQAELDRVAAIEVQLDQCWDLLRQRRARREFGEDASTARARPEAVVEHYLQ